MRDRNHHRSQLMPFLQRQYGGEWEVTLPASGRGHETYVARNCELAYFVKLGANVPVYEVMGSLGLTPPVVTSGVLADGISVLVQPFVDGRNPTRLDFRQRLPEFAAVVAAVHHSPDLFAVLADVFTLSYREAGLAALDRLEHKWQLARGTVPAAVARVEPALTVLRQEIGAFSGGGLVAGHSDICSANWLLADDGSVYLVDLDAMRRDDPAHDLGCLLWWYYPPALRPQFLAGAGYADDAAWRQRIRCRLALHCLDILLPRPGSFDRLDPDGLIANLTDFEAVYAGLDNPRGYED